MSIFLDTSKIELVKKYLDLGIIKGVTTNPTILKKNGTANNLIELEKFSKELSELIDPLPLSIELFTNDFKEMINQALKFSKWAKNINIKVTIHGPKYEDFNLEVINILDSSGKLNKNAQLHIGEDRFDVRKSISLELEESGYLIKIEDNIKSSLENPILLNPYGLVRRTGTPSTQGMWILHEGLLGVFDDTLKEWTYSELQDDDREGLNHISEEPGGWAGITDKYWLAAVIPKQTEKVNFSMRALSGTEDRYQADFLGEAVTVPAKGMVN